MNWRPTTESEIWDDINGTEGRMSREQNNLWETIKIIPEKWQQDPWGNEGKGFWVVAIYGRNVIWYNDIEEGFNRSTYSSYGTIDEYFCNQDNLEWILQHVLDEIREGFPSGVRLRPPQPIA